VLVMAAWVMLKALFELVCGSAGLLGTLILFLRGTWTDGLIVGELMLDEP